MAQSSRPIFEERRDQIFPKLDRSEIERVRRFGDIRVYKAGEQIMTAGEATSNLVVVLVGNVAVTEHDQLGLHQPIVTLGQGDFLGELAQLAG
jgi:thioredoxin reductase (NADPH)